MITTIFLANSLKLIFLLNHATVTAIILPVTNSPPPTKIQISPIGKTDAPNNAPIPPNSLGIDPDTRSKAKKPTPMNAPPKNPKLNMYLRLAVALATPFLQVNS